MPASCTCCGAGKSGWPMQKLMMSLPWRASALTSASTTKAFSVPRDSARLLILSMRYSSFAESAHIDAAIAPLRKLETLNLPAQDIGLRMARVPGERNVRAPALLVAQNHGHRY